MRVGRSQPVRTCVGCGKRAAQRELLRLQAALDGRMVTVPPGNTGGGRSAYVHSRRSCIDRLAKSRLLTRSLRIAVERDAREEIARSLCTMLRDQMTVGETETAEQAGNG